MIYQGYNIKDTTSRIQHQGYNIKLTDSFSSGMKKIIGIGINGGYNWNGGTRQGFKASVLYLSLKSSNEMELSAN
ncbi:hypothetical protein CLCR_09375 [Cladophialophora carrionii]|uniref:Uncharacterized protein n=1 Tax=Cladophialophora carrionii TaxID=86049 RepID=A0A1C1CT90_9EURO|nr:hypothetical protein CLCR_09375 [Cladophialophora carrionii]